MNELCKQYQETYGVTDISAELQEHANSCEACREFTERQQALKKALGEWKTPAFSDNFALEVMSKLTEYPCRRPSLTERIKDFFQSRISIPAPVSAICFGLLVLSLGLNLFFLSNNPPNGVQNGLLTDASTMLPTPTSVNMSNQAALKIPRELIGSGVFLLVPMVDFNPMSPAIQIPENQDEKDEI